MGLLVAVAPEKTRRIWRKSNQRRRKWFFGCCGTNGILSFRSEKQPAVLKKVCLVVVALKNSQHFDEKTTSMGEKGMLGCRISKTAQYPKLIFSSLTIRRRGLVSKG